jgi:predicted hydrocarbon binding protein
LGFIADHLSNPLLTEGKRAIILRKPGIRGLIVGVRERFGTAGEAFLYYNGFEIGMTGGKSHLGMAAELVVKDPARVFNVVSADLFSSIGYGVMEPLKVSAEPPYALVRVRSSFECEVAPKTGKAFSQMVRGMIAGVFSALFGTRMAVEEVKCLAKRDAYCEFEAKPEAKT